MRCLYLYVPSLGKQFITEMMNGVIQYDELYCTQLPSQIVSGTPPCRHGYPDVGQDHIAAHLICLLHCYRKRKPEVGDDGKDKKEASYYRVLTHFAGRGLNNSD
jgi:hypothetical protein